MRDVELFLVGAGIDFPSHLTFQTVDVLAKCESICTNLPESRLSSLPEDLRCKCVSIWSLYKDGRKRSENYDDVVKRVLLEAERHKSVAWLTPGHPVVFDSVTTALCKEGRSRNWQVRVYPAISSIDTILAILEYEPAGGLFIHEATGLVRRNVGLDPSAATLLLQPSVFLSDRAHFRPHSFNLDLSPLCEYLRRFFPEDHLCAFVYSPEVSSETSRVSWVELKNLAAARPQTIMGATLFVPPIKAV
ncbi:SAM-dependent methyltransferase [Mesorhizobium sp. M1405]|uniref:SAM-dependent methyltransferase n=1 Tax=Mesorhizobium sp. M1405 TaxID=2957098 RepID=UPI003336C75A